jgi:Icc-related predicted phosphoesterase
LRLIAASDIHGDYGIIRNFGMAALDLKASAIVLAGDIYPRTERILSHISRLELPVYTVLGNDDPSYESILLDKYPYILNVDGETIDIGPVEIIGCSGLHSIDTFTINEEKIDSILQKAFTKAIKPVVLVTHFPPFKILDLATRHGVNHVGSKAIRNAIEKYRPALCICGHVHKDGGKRASLGKTKIVNIAALERDNVSKSQSRRFAIIDIDEKGNCIVSFDYLLDTDLSLETFVSKYV